MKRSNAEVVARSHSRIRLLSLLSIMILFTAQGMVLAADVKFEKLSDGSAVEGLDRDTSEKAVKWFNSSDEKVFGKIVSDFVNKSEAVKFAEGFQKAALDAESLEDFQREVKSRFEKASKDAKDSTTKDSYTDLLAALLKMDREDLEDKDFLATLFGKNKHLLAGLGLKEGKEEVVRTDDKSKEIEDLKKQIAERDAQLAARVGETPATDPATEQFINTVCNRVDELQRQLADSIRNAKDFGEQFLDQLAQSRNNPQLAQKKNSTLDEILPGLLAQQNKKNEEVPPQNFAPPALAQATPPANDNNKNNSVLDQPIPQPEQPQQQPPQPTNYPTLGNGNNAAKQYANNISAERGTVEKAAVDAETKTLKASNDDSSMSATSLLAMSPVGNNPLMIELVRKDVSNRRSGAEAKLVAAQNKLALMQAESDRIGKDGSRGVDPQLEEDEAKAQNDLNSKKRYYDQLVAKSQQQQQSNPNDPNAKAAYASAIQAAADAYNTAESTLQDIQGKKPKLTKQAREQKEELDKAIAALSTSITGLETEVGKLKKEESTLNQQIMMAYAGQGQQQGAVAPASMASAVQSGPVRRNPVGNRTTTPPGVAGNVVRGALGKAFR